MGGCPTLTPAMGEIEFDEEQHALTCVFGHNWGQEFITIWSNPCSNANTQTYCNAQGAN